MSRVERRAAEAPVEPAPTSDPAGTTPPQSTAVGATPTTVPAPAPSTVPTTVAVAATPTTPPTTGAADGAAIAPVDVERCASSVTVGGLVVVSRGGCLTRTGLVWETSGPADVAGIVAEPVGGSRLVVDPLNARVAGSGYDWTIRGSDGQESIALGLGSGPIDWSFQYPRAIGGVGDGRVEPAQVAARTAVVSRLPGLSDVRSLPQLHAGIHDYRALDDEAVAAYVTANPEVNSTTPVFSFAAVGLTGFAPLELELPAVLTSELLGLPVEPKISITPQANGGTGGLLLDSSLRLPTVLKGYRGSSRVFVGVDGTLRIDRAEVTIPVVELGVVRLKPVNLRYDRATREWYGKVGTYLGLTGNAPGLVGELRIRDGALQRVGVVVAGLPVPIGPGVSLKALGGTLDVEPFAIAGDATVGFGPEILGTPGALDVAGTASISGTETAVRGRFRVASLDLGEMAFGYRYGDRATLAGKIDLTLGTDSTVGVAGAVDGWATTEAFQMSGAVDVALWGLGRVRGDAAVSEGGVAACGKVKLAWFDEWRFGVGYEWGSGRADMLGATCNSRTYLLAVRTRNATTTTTARQASADGGPVLVAAHSGLASATDGPATVTVPEGEKVLAVLLQAPGGVGAVRLRGPDGTVIDPSALGTPGPRDKVVAVRQPDNSQITVLVADPAPGRWTIEPLDGGPISVVVEATEQGFAPVAPSVPVPAAEVTTRSDGRILPPALHDGAATGGPTPDAPAPDPSGAGDRNGARVERAAGPTDGSDDSDWVWILIIGLVVVAGGATASVVVVRRRRTDA